MHLADITPSIFASLGLADAENRLEITESPAGRELLFLVDGLGADVIEKYSSIIPFYRKPNRLHRPNLALCKNGQ